MSQLTAETVSFSVELTAFGDPGEVRQVDVPAEQVSGRKPEEYLESIFYFGQNDFQPKPHPSVSAGDIITVENDKYLVCGIGFRKLTKDEYERFIKTDRRGRIVNAMLDKPNVSVE